MWGAIIGDIVGSRFEFNNYRGKDFELFTSESVYTDDSVLSVAVAQTLLKYERIDDKEAFEKDLVSAFKKYGREYLCCGFGNSFFEWILAEESKAYGSYGNGSAMRVSPVAWYAKSLEEAERIAKWTAEITHNHPEGIKGAVVTAGSIFLAKEGKSKAQIAEYIESFGYSLDTSVAKYRLTNRFDETCQKTIPVAMRCFLEGYNFEDVIRNSICVGGDSDTIAAIAGSVGEAFFGVDYFLKEKVRGKLDKNLYAVVKEFDEKYVSKVGLD